MVRCLHEPFQICLNCMNSLFNFLALLLQIILYMFTLEIKNRNANIQKAVQEITQTHIFI